MVHLNQKADRFIYLVVEVNNKVQFTSFTRQFIKELDKLFFVCYDVGEVKIIFLAQFRFQYGVRNYLGIS